MITTVSYYSIVITTVSYYSIVITTESYYTVVITDETETNCERFMDERGMYMFLDCFKVNTAKNKLHKILCYYMASVMRKGTFGHMQKVLTQTSRGVGDAASGQRLHFLYPPSN